MFIQFVLLIVILETFSDSDLKTFISAWRSAVFLLLRILSYLLSASVSFSFYFFLFLLAHFWSIGLVSWLQNTLDHTVITLYVLPCLSLNTIQDHKVCFSEFSRFSHFEQEWRILNWNHAFMFKFEPAPWTSLTTYQSFT